MSDAGRGLHALVLSTLVAFSLVASVTAISGAVAAAGNAAPDCSTVSYSGDGSSANPHQVATVAQLQCIEAQGLDQHYDLTGDLDASGTATWNGGSGFDPIGDTSNEFTGTFDGKEHTIAGLTIDRAGTYSVGLFSEIESGGTITAVSLDGGTVTGARRVGQLAGFNDGTVEDSHASGEVDGTKRVGGLVGRNDGTVQRSSASGERSRAGDWVGGLVGFNQGLIDRSYATRPVVGEGGGFDGASAGGLVGVSTGTIADSYATGSVTASWFVGGLIGSYQADPGGTTRRSYATGALSIDDESQGIGGLVGSVGIEDTSVEQAYWDVGTTDEASVTGGGNDPTTLIGVSGFGATADTAPAPEMQGASAEANLPGLDFTSTWETVERGDGGAAADGYPILQGLDRRAQLRAQGIARPTVESITRSRPATQETAADSVAFEVSFPEPVQRVSVGDFTRSGSATGSIDGVNRSSGSTITVTVDAVSGDGSLGLDLASSGDITNSAGNSLVTSEPGTDETYTIDNTVPSFSNGASTTVSTAENAVGDVTDVDATDGGGPDAGLSYSLGGADAAAFSVDAATGELSLDAPQDFEQPSDGNADGEYELTITATDQVGNAQVQTLTVTITDAGGSDGGGGRIAYEQFRESETPDTQRGETPDGETPDVAETATGPTPSPDSQTPSDATETSATPATDQPGTGTTTDDKRTSGGAGPGFGFCLTVTALSALVLSARRMRA